jgi:hypothetical protein
MSVTAARSGPPEHPPGGGTFHSHLRTPAASDLAARVAVAGPDGWDASAAAFFAIACAWSYGDGQTLADVLHRCGFGGSCRLVRAAAGALFVDTDVYVVADDRFAALVFRGTEIGDAKVIDVLSDFYSHTEPFFAADGAGAVHVGFQQAYLPVHDLLMDVLRFDVPDVPALYVCGHSLGGALAVLAAATLLLSRDPALDPVRGKFRGLYTYGQPMVGDDLFAKRCQDAFGDRTFRHVYQHDLIPRLPPWWTSGRFAHFGGEYRGSETGSWTPVEGAVDQVATAIVPLAIAAGGFVGQQVRALRWLAARLPYSLDDHRPQAYVDCSKLAVEDFAFP